MANLQLKLTTPIEELVPKMIEFNGDEISAAIAEKLEYYRVAVYNDETIKSAKTDLASLNKLKDALDGERIAICKRYNEPAVKFKGEVDKIIAVVVEAASNIKKQVDEHARKLREEKRRKLVDYYELQAADLIAEISYDRIEDPSWLNASVSERKAQQEIESKIAAIRTDLETVSKLSSEDIDELRLFYIETLSLSKTLQENEARKQRAARIAQMRAEREQAEKLEAERREAAQRANLEAKTDDAEAPPAPPAEFTPPAIEEEKPRVYTYRFEVSGSLEQMKALKKFFADNGIKIKAI